MVPYKVRDPVRALEWAPEAAVEFADQKAAAAAAVVAVPPPADSANRTAYGAAAQPATNLSGTGQPADGAGILDKRRRHLGPNLALFFPEQPLHIVRGKGCELFDPEGACYLDCINNVSHVGHAHPAVAAALSSQLHTLNTNSRYLHPALADYAEALAGLMPDPLQVAYFTASGSEANDLAWRIACAAATAAIEPEPEAGLHGSIKRSGVGDSSLAAAGRDGALHVACVDHAYHGHTSFCIDISPYKFKGAGGRGRAAYVHVLPCPDVFRSANLDGAAAARAAIEAAERSGGRIAAFFSESILSCGGQVVLPEGYLAGVYREMRAAGAVCVADEVQCGFGRVGRAFWAFELQGVVPDIVTFGKPCGNGFPMAGLVTTRRLAEAFSNGMEFFATFGGCTAAAACGLAVLDVIRGEQLQDNAARVGAYCLDLLRELQAEHPDVVGEVRGEGLMIGVEMVTDPASRTPSPALARWLKTHCKRHGRVLLSSEGPFSSVIKIKPPICFSEAQAERMVGALRQALGALDAGERAQLAADSRAEVEAIAERHRRLG